MSEKDQVDTVHEFLFNKGSICWMSFCFLICNNNINNNIPCSMCACLCVVCVLEREINHGQFLRTFLLFFFLRTANYPLGLGNSRINILLMGKSGEEPVVMTIYTLHIFRESRPSLPMFDEYVMCGFIQVQSLTHTFIFSTRNYKESFYHRSSALVRFIRFPSIFS